ncbi:hypothetical protein VDG1235_3318 [Verrucomicrobiia bacterium DG1235]|nr:hypothetical protein VDG1235_3318 [Verrucomicrobiae bacterium DG1235]
MSLIESERPFQVEVRSVDGGYSLFRDGKPFFVKGAGGFKHIDRLAEFGGNSVRTWGAEQTDEALADIGRVGLSLCAGLWLVPPRQGFDYADSQARAIQFEELKRQVLKLKDEPALLVWGVGNELDLGGVADESVWEAVEEVAAFIKQVDPFHPVMTVLSSVDKAALSRIEAICPSIDFVSVNAYGDLELVQPKLDAAGWTRPYLVTEWGANGHWEVACTKWEAEIEPTSTEKAEQIRRRYRSLDGSHGQCLGSYVFLWGNKQETTPTWFGLFSPSGRTTEAVEAMGALWKGEAEMGKCPQISSLRLNGRLANESLSVRVGERVSAEFSVIRGNPAPKDVLWTCSRESVDKRSGGDAELAAASVLVDIERKSIGEVSFLAPTEGGFFRLYLEVLGPNNTVATANFPFRVVI